MHPACITPLTRARLAVTTAFFSNGIDGKRVTVRVPSSVRGVIVQPRVSDRDSTFNRLPFRREAGKASQSVTSMCDLTAASIRASCVRFSLAT